MVKIFSAILIFSLALSSSAFAQKKSAKKKARPAPRATQTKTQTAVPAPVPAPETPAPIQTSAPEEAQSETAAPAPTRARKAISSFSQFGMNFSFWQETIGAKKGSAETDIRALFQGVNFRYAYNSAMSGRWRNPYFMDLGFGFVKGKGTAATIQDELKSQPWTNFSLTPALIYRTTEVSDFGFGLPLAYRMIQWKLNEASGLEMDKKSSLSAGISMIHINRFTNSAFLTLALAHQINWNATVWSLGLDFKF
ncbi:MAG: hypothetical protein AB7O96_07435 [Pseudobdellovibrionaceae bacterium]